MLAHFGNNLSFVIAFALAQVSLASAQNKSIVVASTTSTQDSGLFGHILPLFKAKTGIDVKVVALGTGQALDTARRGNAREAEEEGRLKDRIVDVKEGASPANVKIKVGGGIIRRRLRSSSSNLQGAKPPTRSSRRAISWSS